MKTFGGNFYFTRLFLIGLLLEIATAVPQWHNSTDGRQYLIEADLKYNWFHAHNECARKNLQLVEIDSQAKNQALVVLLKSLFGKSRNLWLGANDEYNRAKDFKRPFYWATSGKLMTFSYWSNGNPDNYRNNEHCVHTWESAPDYRWNDVPCESANLGYICEENQMQVLARKAAADKQKQLSQTMTKVLREFQEQQMLQMQKLEIVQKDITKEENDLQELIHNIQTKLEVDIAHILAQHKKELYSAVENRNNKITNVNVEMRSSIEVMNKKFTKDLEAVQGIINAQ